MMISEQTITKLNEMKLTKMAEVYREQLLNKEHEVLSFDDRFSLMVDVEWSKRQNNKLERLITGAQLRYHHACVEDIEYYPDRKLDKSLILRLGSCHYIQENHNIIIKGPSGAGKTYVSCAFAIAACRQYYRVKYVRLPDLLDELSIARGEGIFRKVMKQYKKVQLLVLDEWLLTELTEQQARDLLELIEARHETSSTIFCSQFDTKGWYEKLGEDTLADAILDRIIHTSHEIFIDGEISMRERYGIDKQASKTIEFN